METPSQAIPSSTSTAAGTPARRAVRPPVAGRRRHAPAPSPIPVTVVGDSIMIDVAPELHRLLPYAYITGQVSRQMAALPSVLAQLSAAGQLYPRLVIELGSNGPGWDPGQVAALLRSLKLQQVVLVNAGQDPRHPDWPTIINQELDQVAAAVPGTTIVDWYTASTGHPEYFMWGTSRATASTPDPSGPRPWRSSSPGGGVRAARRRPRPLRRPTYPSPTG